MATACGHDQPCAVAAVCGACTVHVTAAQAKRPPLLVLRMPTLATLATCPMQMAFVQLTWRSGQLVRRARSWLPGNRLRGVRAGCCVTGQGATRRFRDALGRRR